MLINELNKNDSLPKIERLELTANVGGETLHVLIIHQFIDGYRSGSVLGQQRITPKSLDCLYQRIEVQPTPFLDY